MSKSARMDCLPEVSNHSGSKNVADTWNKSSRCGAPSNDEMSNHRKDAMPIRLRDCNPLTFPHEHDNSGMPPYSSLAILDSHSLLHTSLPALPYSSSRTVVP